MKATQLPSVLVGALVGFVISSLSAFSSTFMNVTPTPTPVDGQPAGLLVAPEGPYGMANGTIHYPGHKATTIAAGGNGFVDSNRAFNDYDLNASSTSVNAAQLIVLDVTYNNGGAAISGNETVQIQAGVSQGNPVTVPVVGIGAPSGHPTDDSACRSALLTLNGVNYCPYPNVTPGTAVRIAFYPKDICAVSAGNSVQGCKSDGTTLEPSTDSTLFNLTLTPGDYTQGAGFVKSSSASAVSVNLSFHNSVAAITGCSLLDAYFPGDGQILVKTSNVISGYSIGSVNGAPISSLLVLGNRSSLNVSSTNYFTNDVVQRVGYALGDQPVGGFQNVSATATNKYSVVFTLIDAAGIITKPDTTNCQIDGVQTSKILGFMHKSNCFIATGAFRSDQAAPVQMLQRFRDRILLKTLLGRHLVRWYYSWSPRAATWLVENPEWRFLVLRALVPIEVLAWIFLHPIAAVLSLIFFAGALFSGRAVGQRIHLT